MLWTLRLITLSTSSSDTTNPKASSFLADSAPPQNKLLLAPREHPRFTAQWKNVNCSFKSSILSHVAIRAESVCPFSSHPPQVRQHPETTLCLRDQPSTAPSHYSNETVLHRKQSAEFGSLASNLLFWLCCLRVSWSHKSSLHTGHRLAPCQVLTSREMQFILLNLPERKKSLKKKKKELAEIYIHSFYILSFPH